LQAPLFGRIGLSIRGGVSIYGPMEAGFEKGFVCTDGSCPCGMDLATCAKKMYCECTASSVSVTAFLDVCGGHAGPYHYHADMKCSWNASDASGHSELAGVLLDGRGLYGYYESAGLVIPTDLDSCNGHYGNVPAFNYTTKNGSQVYFPGGTHVYHYHLTTDAPYTVPCYGPVTSLQACKNLFPNFCGNVSQDETFNTTSGKLTYNKYCPCYRYNSTVSQYNQAYDGVPVCAGSTSATSTGSKGATSFEDVHFVVLAILVGFLAFIGMS